MELTQQVKNFQATIIHSQRTKPQLKSEDKNVYSHEKSLQALANGHNVSYQSTLRIVQNQGARGPALPPRVTRKQHGYIRNESGAAFPALRATATQLDILSLLKAWVKLR